MEETSKSYKGKIKEKLKRKIYEKRCKKDTANSNGQKIESFKIVFFYSSQKPESEP